MTTSDAAFNELVKGTGAEVVEGPPRHGRLSARDEQLHSMWGFMSHFLVACGVFAVVVILAGAVVIAGAVNGWWL